MSTTTSPTVTARHAVALPCGPHSPAVARRVTERWLRTADPSVRVADAVLIVSELVTNAVRHTRDSCLLTLTVRDRELDIAVADHCEDLPDLKCRADADGRGGFGMNIVQQLGSEVRVVPAIDGKTVHVMLGL